MANAINIVISAIDKATAPIRAIEGEVSGLAGAAKSAAIGINAIAASQITQQLAQMVTATINMARNFGQSAEQLSRQSRALGVSTTDLQVYRLMIKEAGGDAEELTMALTFLNRAIATHNPLLRRLIGDTTDTSTAFLQLVTILSQSKDVSLQTQAAFELLGRGSTDMIADFANIARGFKATKDEVVADSSIMSDHLIAQGNKVDEEFDRIERRWAATWHKWALDGLDAIGIITRAWSPTLSGFGSRRDEPAGPGTAPINDAAGVDKLKNAFNPPGVLPQGAIDLEKLQGIRDLLPAVQRDIGRSQIAFEGLAKSVQLFANTLPVAVTEFRDAMAQMADAGAVFSDTVNGIFDGLQFSIGEVLRKIVLEGRVTFADLLGVVRAVVDAILQEIARIAAAKIATAIAGVAASIIGGIFGLGGPIAIGAAAGAGVGLVDPSLSRPSVGGRSGGVTNITFNAIDARSIADQFDSPFGAFRVADQRMQSRRDWR